MESVLEDDDSRLDYRADRWTAYRTERRSAQRVERRDLRRTELRDSGRADHHAVWRIHLQGQGRKSICESGHQVVTEKFFGCTPRYLADSRTNHRLDRQPVPRTDRRSVGLASLQATRRTDCRAVRRADRRAKSRGSAAIKHYILRLTLWLRGYTPFHFARFLDQCARLILIKKVGGGYIFTHRMLLEYFAEMTPQSPNLRQSPYVNRTKEISDRGTLTAKPMVPKWKMWLFVCVVLALFVTLCQWGIKLFSERILHTVTSLATLQPFDERLSLS